MDDWGNILQTAIEQEPMAWIYFVSFVIISAFIVANLFIAVVISNLEEVIRGTPATPTGGGARIQGRNPARTARSPANARPPRRTLAAAPRIAAGCARPHGTFSRVAKSSFGSP